MKLTDICEFHGGSQPPKSEWSSEYKDGYIRMLQIRDFTQEGRVTPEYVKISNRLRLCTEDDILIGRYGASVGKILSGKSGAYNVAIMKAVPDTSVVRKQYLRYYFLSPNFQNYILNLGGRAAQAGFSKDDLARLEITVVSLEEQDKIVNELSTLEKTISTKQKQLKEFDDLVKSRFIEMFGDPLSNSKGYDLSDYGSLFELNAGGTPSKNKPEYWENGNISWIGSNMCQDTILYENDGKYITELGFNNSSARMFPKNTVLVALVGATIGKTALLKFETTTNQNVLGIRGIEESGNNPYFVFYYTQGLHKFFMDISDGGFAMASKGFISKLPFPIVDISLQNDFADFVKLIDKSKFVG